MSGYSPASTLISNLPQAQAIHYDTDFIRNLKANTPFLRCTERRSLPPQSGNQHRLYMYNTFGPNTTQVSEGTVGSGITPTVNQTTAVIGQYADYCNVSDIALETAIDPALENLEREVTYRLAQSLSILVRTQADGASTVDSSVNNANAAGQLMTRPLLTQDGQSLAGRNVVPYDMAANRFVGIIHPFIVGDVYNDPSNNGLVDVLKRTSDGADKLKELPGDDEEIQVLDWYGFRFYQSSLVTQGTIGGNTSFRTYIFGNQAVISISLGVKEDAQIGDGDWNNMKIWMMKAGEPSVSDPSRVIGGWVSYNVKFVATLPPDTVMRLRTRDANSGIS